MQWQKKLYQHEENPPTVIWDELTKVLADEPYKIRQSLNDYSVTPPSNIWEHISNNIGDKEIPVTIPFLYKIRNSSALSYAAAITGIGLFIALIVFLVNNKPNEIGVKDLAAGLNFQDSPLTETNKDTNQDIQNNQSLTQPAQDNITLENKNQKVEDKIPSDGSLAISAIKSPTATIAKNTNPNKSSQNKNSQKVSYSDGNYILVYENDGQTKRVSYKLADMVQSLHTNDHSSGNTQADTRRWNRKITEWKEKMGNSTFIPSGTNFFDIAEMAEMLNTEK
jgi:hypothetical protein